MFPSPFHEIAAILIIAALVGLVGVRLRQPLIVTFIAVGIIVGPAGLGLTAESPHMDLLAHFGIALLLFVVGLKLDLHLIRTMGPVALATGLGQVLFTSVVGFFIALGLGLGPVPALYVAVALTFSSTIIIVKLLSDKREIDALHGRIAMGFLIVQDIVVVIVMILLNAFGREAPQDGAALQILAILIQGVLFLGLLALVMRFILPGLMHHLARSTELLIVFSIAWAISIAAAADAMGFSLEVGAFLAGVSLAPTTYREAIGARLVSVRDFLLLFFFIDLGARMDLSMIGAQVLPAMVLSLFVLVGNPIIVMVIMGWMGYRKRTGFLAGLTVAQISEFSLILAALGMTLGHITEETMGLITLVGLVTIGISTYLILYSHPLYERLSPWLSIFERRVPHHEEEAPSPSKDVDVIVFGLGRYGSRISEGLMARGRRVLGVDFDPEVVEAWREMGRAAQYGDAEDPEFAAMLPLAKARWVICAVPLRETNLTLLHALREHGYDGRVALAAHTAADAALLEEAGADLVLVPFADAAIQAVDVLSGQQSPARFAEAGH